jgi:hypothetical protein
MRTTCPASSASRSSPAITAPSPRATESSCWPLSASSSLRPRLGRGSPPRCCTSASVRVRAGSMGGCAATRPNEGSASVHSRAAGSPVDRPAGRGLLGTLRLAAGCYRARASYPISSASITGADTCPDDADRHGRLAVAAIASAGTSNLARGSRAGSVAESAPCARRRCGGRTPCPGTRTRRASLASGQAETPVTGAWRSTRSRCSWARRSAGRGGARRRPRSGRRAGCRGRQPSGARAWRPSLDGAVSAVPEPRAART